jgi:hypothetical protein
MKRSIVLVMFLMINSCGRKVDVQAPNVVLTQRYAYIKTEDGRVYIIASNTRDFDEAMKAIRPGPASVDKLDLWVITPAAPVKKGIH